MTPLSMCVLVYLLVNLQYLHKPRTPQRLEKLEHHKITLCGVRATQRVTPPLCLLLGVFTAPITKKDPVLPPAPISMNQLRMGPWHARHPSSTPPT